MDKAIYKLMIQQRTMIAGQPTYILYREEPDVDWETDDLVILREKILELLNNYTKNQLLLITSNGFDIDVILNLNI